MTNKSNTYAVLNSYFLNTETMRINEDYLNYLLDVEKFSNDYRIYDAIKNTKRKATSIVWQAFMEFTNTYLEYEGYSTTCSSNQLKSWLNEYGRGYESLAESVKTVEAMRSEE